VTGRRWRESEILRRGLANSRLTTSEKSKTSFWRFGVLAFYLFLLLLLFLFAAFPLHHGVSSSPWASSSAFLFTMADDAGRRTKASE